MTPERTCGNTNAFTRFMASGYGRLTRLGMGVAFITAGLTLAPAPAGKAIAAFGLVPIAAGALDLCPVAPLWGGHFRGAKYRTSETEQHTANAEA
jgi:hypothetical protein